MEKINVSLTSIKCREKQVRQTLESLVKQDIELPYQINLYLSREPYLLDEGFASQPDWPELQTDSYRMKVHVHFVPNTGPYRKLLPILSYLRQVGLDSPIVTCDDDTVYPVYWLRKLLEEHELCRGIVAFRGHTMSVKNGGLADYSAWLKEPKLKFSLLNLATGKDGILYRPSLLDFRVLDVATALRLAPTADDLWFKVHSLLAFSPVRILSTENSGLAPAKGLDMSTALWSCYNSKGGNDQVFQVLLKHAAEKYRCSLDALIFNAAEWHSEPMQQLGGDTPLALQNLYRHLQLFEMISAENDSFLRNFSQRRDIIRRSAAASGLKALQKLVKPKLILAIKTWNRKDYLKKCLESFINTYSRAYNWTVLVADDGSTDGTLQYLERLSLPVPFQLIKNQNAYACGQFNSLNDHALAIGYDVCFHADDDIIFVKSGWDTLYLNAMRDSGFQHLCYRNLQHYESLVRKQKNPSFSIPLATIDKSGSCAAYVDVLDCDGSFFTVTPQVFRRVGYADEVNFPIRGQWHIDYSMRCVRAGFNRKKTFFDAYHSNDYITLQALSSDYRCSLPWGEAYKKTKDSAELARRHKLIADESRLFHGPSSRRAFDRTFEKHLWTAASHPAHFSGLNNFADRVYLINLDSRPDRLKVFDLQAKRLGFEYTRIPAVDGRSREVAQKYEAYILERRSHTHFGKEGRIKSQAEFYLDPQFKIVDREIYLERNGVPAIASVGAWAYRETYIRILREAIERGYENIVIFDDDVLFHDDFNALFTDATIQLPDDWMIWMLGAMQFGWKPEQATFKTAQLYSCNGSSVASHATALKGNAIKLLLAKILEFLAPVDIGPLSLLQRKFKNRCFISFPNLAIQSGIDSDINTSSVHGEGRKADNRFRWEIQKYSCISNLAC